MGALIDRFMEVDMTDTMKIYEIFCRQSKQFDELEAFYSWCRSIGIARPSEFPEIEKITQKKLDLLDELIRDKSALAQGNVNRDEPEREPEIKELEPEPEEDINAIKALPPPAENFFEEEEKVEDDNSKAIVVQQEVDFLNLGENAMSSEDHADKLALALFDGAVPAATSSGSGWDTLKADAGWETALVQSARQLMAAVTSSAATGSASSVAFGSAGRSAATLTLPAPPSSNGNKNNEPVAVDPFAASLTVAPPSYVQMSDMEKKQKLLMEEQVMWDQFKRNGMRGGNVAMSNVQQQTYPYNQGGWYTHNYY
ncbi:hypothetical protein Gotri_021772 [Gossypium trilobum]|uniref:AP180 N-terminal homology (ANTH) domain-containing protein n=1 Tax=Gossypium trilobum TaxID=34281 RepID=A0A7J9DDI1_9ROSI|nr:hypothetical protein [Gossypium trilobum]